MDPTPVDRCVCHKIAFAELLRIHRETGADLERLQKLTRCGTSCGMCISYIRVVLATGRVRLPIMTFEPRRDRTK